MKKLALLLLAFTLLLSGEVFSSTAEELEAIEDNTPADDGGTFPFYKPEGRPKVPTNEKLKNFGAVYASQWVFYLYSQEDIIRKHGSIRNWYEHPLSPRFDKDSFEYNIFKHSFVGNYYYLFYRSRGYTEKNAFFWSFMSSLAFEFTVETITEKPSYQDIYQTPVFGAIVGIGFEKLSIYFHEWETWYGSVLGFIVNPMTLIPQFARDKDQENLSAYPLIDHKTTGAVVSYKF